VNSKTEYEFHEKGLLQQAKELSQSGAPEAWIALALVGADSLRDAHSNMVLLNDAFAYLNKGCGDE